MHHHDDHTTYCIYYNVSLSPFDQLAAIKPNFRHGLGCSLRALTINDGAGWLGVAAFFLDGVLDVTPY